MVEAVIHCRNLEVSISIDLVVIGTMSHPEQESAQAHSNVKSEQMAPTSAPTSSSCRKKKSESSSNTFFGDIVEHIDEFVHASYDEHKTCLQKTLNKVR